MPNVPVPHSASRSGSVVRAWHHIKSRNVSFCFNNLLAPVVNMATLRISTASLSQRAITTCRPRLYLGVRVRSGHSFAPIAKASHGDRKYSTATPAPSLAPRVERGGSKLFKDADAAVADIKSGSTILSSGFGLCGVAGMVCGKKCTRED